MKRGDTMNGIGKKIKQRRTELGITQIELAKRMGYTSKAAISKVENGDDNLTTSRISQFADALDLSVSYLMGWDDNYDPEAEYIANARAFYEKYLSADRKTRKMIDMLLDGGDE